MSHLDPQAVELNLFELWGHRSPDEQFLLLFLRAARNVLEQPAALKSSTASLRETLWRLIALPAQRYEQAEGTVSTLVRVILEHEHATTHLAELMQHLYTEHDAVRIVADLVRLARTRLALAPLSPRHDLSPARRLPPALPSQLRELASLPASEMGVESANKNIASFLHALAVRAPLVLVANVELLQPHLNAESYALRCGAVSSYGQLLIQTANFKEGHAEVQDAIQSMQRVLIHRLCDVSAYVRCRSLQTLGQVCENRALGLSGFHMAAEAGLERLADKNANVRRGALQLFSTLLEFNPFGPSLNRAKLERLRDELRQITQDAVDSVMYVAASDATAVCERSVAADDQVVATESDIACTDTREANNPAPLTREQCELKAIESALEFEEVLRRHLNEVVALLGSQTTSDVVEAANALVAAHCFQLEGARPSAILTLVFSKEAAVKAAALNAAQSVYLHFTNAKRSGTLEQAIATSTDLLSLVRDANLAELTSLEEIVAEWQRQKLLPASFFSTLWEVVQGRCNGLTASADRCGALALLNMAGTADAQLLRCKQDLLIAQMQTHGQLDLTFARHLCVALQRAAAIGNLVPKTARAVTRVVERLLVHAPHASQTNVWFATAEQAIAVLFAYNETPEHLCSSVLRSMGATICKPSDAAEATICSAALSRLLFSVGHVAMKTLVHIEACDKVLTSRRNAALNGSSAPEEKQPAKSARKQAPDAAKSDSLAEELGATAATAEADSEYLLSLGDKLLSPDALLGAWAPLISSVCVNADGRFGAELRSSAVLALCKLMSVSATFCEEKLQLLFSVMRCEPEAYIRANIAVALGDLAVVHSNVMEPWTPQLYAQLRDSEPRVRKNVVMVLTHLILNDMIKVKGQVSELALRMRDDDERIASLARLFFSEFAKKSSSPVYNLLPDIVSSLSSDKTLEPDAFRDIMAFLLGFLEKGKHTESMVDKLCPRFDTSDEVCLVERSLFLFAMLPPRPESPLFAVSDVLCQVRLHRDIAFCVCSLAHTDKSIRKLQEQFKTYGNKLGDSEVFACFTGLISKYRKAAAGELKPALDELEALLERSQAVDNGDEAAEGEAEGGEAAPSTATSIESAVEGAGVVIGNASSKGGGRAAKGMQKGGRAAKHVPKEGDNQGEKAGDENCAPRDRGTVAPSKGARATRQRGTRSAD